MNPSTSTTPLGMRYGVRKAQRGAAGRRGPLPWVSRGSCGIVFRIQEDAVNWEWKRCKPTYREEWTGSKKWSKWTR